MRAVHEETHNFVQLRGSKTIHVQVRGSKTIYDVQIFAM